MKKTILSLLSFMTFIPAAYAADITKQEVMDAQMEWAKGIENISKVFIEEGDFEQAARDHINTLYAYDLGEVLFKPTLASSDQFRENFDEALSYFVGGAIAEDKGFAIKPWTKVRFDDDVHIVTYNDYAVSMGNYFFTPQGSDVETKVEFTFGYIKDAEGNLRINVHHSSLPFTPAE
ncbi:MAG: phosphoribosyl-AMP cyclohydrolase [Pseudomonadota bacterium]